MIKYLILYIYIIMYLIIYIYTPQHVHHMNPDLAKPSGKSPPAP